MQVICSVSLCVNGDSTAVGAGTIDRRIVRVVTKDTIKTAGKAVKVTVKEAVDLRLRPAAGIAVVYGEFSTDAARHIRNKISVLRRLLQEYRPRDEAQTGAIQSTCEHIFGIYDSCAGDKIREAVPGGASMMLAIAQIRQLPKRGNDWENFISTILALLKDANRNLVLFLEANGIQGTYDDVDWDNAKDNDLVKSRTVAQEIKSAWKADTSLAPLSALSTSIIERAAQVAATALARHEETEFIDSVSGLVLPPKMGKPYRERGHHSNGRRLDLFEHLEQEYGPYLDAGLLFSGHLFELDRPAYEALLYSAEKEAKAKGLKKGVNTADFALRHKLLTSEHLATPPEGYERQAEILRNLRTSKRAAGMTHAATSKLNKAHEER